MRSSTVTDQIGERRAVVKSDASGAVRWGRIPAWWVAVALLILARGAPAAEPGSAPGPLVVAEGPDEIAVTCRAEPRWKAVVDRAHGGAIRHFSLPDDGPNLIADELKTDGTVNPFRGMFNTFYMSRIDQGDSPEARIKAKGRSEERRVGKEWRARGAAKNEKRRREKR